MIADASREQLLKAMEDFDRDLRESSDYLRWEDNKAQVYAIEHEGKRYPPKVIVSLATGTPVSDFSGGIGNTNDYLRERGFVVIAIRLAQAFSAILKNYDRVRRTQLFNHDNELYRQVEVCGDILSSDDVIGGTPVRVQVSVGKGQWTKTPWIALLDPRETDTPQRGVYVVLLFRQDFSGVYATLNQGVTEPIRRLGTTGGLLEVRQLARQIRDRPKVRELAELGFRLDDGIDLRADPGLGRNYEASTIAYKLYETEAIPKDEEIIADIRALVSSYEDYVEAEPRFGDERVTEEPLCLIGTWKDAEKWLDRVRDAISENGGWASWWSFPIRQAAQSLLTEPFYLYLNSGGGRFPLRARVAEYVTSQGNEGIETPWPEITDPESLGRTRAGNRQSEIYKTWFRIDALEPLVPELELSDFEPAPGLSTPESILNQSTFGYAHRSARRHSMDELEEHTLLDRALLEEIVKALTSPVENGGSPQIVFAGPPGTSKTWVAESVAKYITGDNGRVRLVQFHPNYSYEAFVQGLRPVAGERGIAFKLEDGALLSLVGDMEKNGDLGAGSPLYALIIDEMNRANLPRVFGELMYLFEYREKAIRLQYSEGFGLPPNLRFIGTMNTADRSIRSIDIALRRRFDVFELGPDVKVLRRFFASRPLSVPELFDGFEKLNAKLQDDLDRHHTIGHAFFMKSGLDRGMLRAIWRRKIYPLIEEYFFDQLDIARSEYLFEGFWPE